MVKKRTLFCLSFDFRPVTASILPTIISHVPKKLTNINNKNLKKKEK